MTTERLTSGDKRLIAAVILITAVSIGYVKLNYFAAFPEASIDLRHSKTEITRMAGQFLRWQGLATEGFRNLTLFDSDETARTYLEREVGLEEANRLMSGPVSVWRWRARWFRPPDKEEMIVWLRPAGGVAGFEHVIPEDAPGARLDKDAARRLAESFLRERTGAAHRVVEEQLVERPKRYDYVFTWEQEDFRVKDARYRRAVVVQGDRIGRYSEYLFVPEVWKRDFAKLRSANDLYSQIAQAAGVLLVLAAIAALVPSFRRGRIHWRPLLVITGAVAGLMVVNQWNAIPFAIDGMPTSSPYHQSLIFALLMGLGAGVGVFFYVIVAAAAGEPLYRDAQPRNVSLLALTDRRVVRTREFFLSTVIGYGFAAAHIAFVVAFYLIGRRFGVWSPQDVNYSDFLSTGLPWIYPLTISLLASTSEEFWFRLLAVPLLKRWLRSTWLAVVIPAFVWGFLHANYPQQPGYIRGLEVGVVGVAAGFLMLRFGILATLIWHYTVDAILIGMFLIRSENWHFQLSGWIVGGAVAFPLLVSLVFYRRHGGFLTDPDLFNAGTVKEPQPPGVAEAGEPLAPWWPVKWLYAAAIVAGAAGLAAQVPRFGDFIRVRLSRLGAEQAAIRELTKKVKQADSWRRVTEFVPNLDAKEFEYVRRLQGANAANKVVRERTGAGLWRARFFQPLRKEEWRMFVEQNGSVTSVEHLLDEKAPGASLEPGGARQIAEEFLAREKGLPIGSFRLVDSSTDKRERRTDHTFVWEDDSFRVGEAKARVSVDVIGDQPSGFERFLKLPEQWVREFERPRLAGVLIPSAIGAVGLLLLVLFVKRLGERKPDGSLAHRQHWKVYLPAAAAAALAAAASSLNRWPQLLARYPTAEPIEGYITQALLGWLMRSVLTGMALFLAILAADVFLQAAAGDRRLRRPSIVRAGAVFALLWGLSRVLSSLGQRIAGPRISLPLWNLPGVDTVFPAVEALSSAFLSAATLVLVGAVVVSAASRYLKARQRWLLMAAGATLYAAAHAQSLLQFGWLFATALVVGGAIVALAFLCAADLVTFATALFWLFVAAPAAMLIEQPAACLRWNGIFCAVLAVLIGIGVSRRLNVSGSGG